MDLQMWADLICYGVALIGFMLLPIASLIWPDL
jgi:hypothetical protein